MHMCFVKALQRELDVGNEIIDAIEQNSELWVPVCKAWKLFATKVLNVLKKFRTGLRSTVGKILMKHNADTVKMIEARPWSTLLTEILAKTSEDSIKELRALPDSAEAHDAYDRHGVIMNLFRLGSMGADIYTTKDSQARVQLT